MFVIYPVLVMIYKPRGMHDNDGIFRDLSAVVATDRSGSISGQGRWRCPASTIFADSCCLIQKCYRNFSTWVLPTSANSGIAGSPAMGSPAVA